MKPMALASTGSRTKGADDPNSRGYTAEVRVGSSPTRPFVVISKEQTTKARTTFGLRPRSGRYLMLWITSMPEEGAAAVNEITVTAAN